MWKHLPFAVYNGLSKIPLLENKLVIILYFTRLIVSLQQKWIYGSTELRKHGSTEGRIYGISESQIYGITESPKGGIKNLWKNGITEA